MGGRPPVVGLLAVVAGVLLASLLAAPPACAQMRIPLFSDTTPKVVKKKPFRPMLPNRNPMRATAGVSADAVVPPKAENSDVSAVVGTSSSASVTVALAGATAGKPDATNSASTGSESSDVSSDTETSQSDASAAPQDVAALSGDADSDTAPADEKAPADSANNNSASYTTGGVTPNDVDEDDASAIETTETPQADETADETAPTTTPADDEAPSETEQATESADASPVPVTAKPAEAPSYDASVVLEVSPPPDDVKIASAAGSNDGISPANDTKKTQTAALTPPDAPVPDAVSPAEDETPSAAEAESDSDAADSDKTANAPNEHSEAATEPTEAEPTAVEPPPAHPVVAAIRARLADPSVRKGVSAADLRALEEFYGTREGPPLWVTEAGFSDKARAVIEEIGKADDWGLDASAFDLPPANDLLATQNALADDELQLSIAVLKYARYAQVGRLTPRQASPLFDQHPRARNPKTVLTEIAAASAPDAYLTSLHPQHEQFKRLHQALLKERAAAKARGTKPSNDSDVQLIKMNMERWRWLPRHLGTLYVWNNVPEFNTRVVKNGKTIYVEKTIVGQLKYATPLFSAPMRNIVFHPDWTVPPTIVNEDLAPKLRGDGGFFGNANTAVLRNHGLNVSLKGKPLDPDSVDWKNVNVREYTFTQEPGPANVLGELKFNFPNRHAIYMHDTVQPELFDERVRSLSHGCIRVHDPDRFAALLLGQDKGWSMAQVRNKLANNQTSVVGLNRLIPVHITYFTAVVDENGNVNKLGDIYGIDNRMAKKMFKNPATFPIPASPADLEANNRDQVRSRQRTGGLDGLISGLFGN